MAGAPSSMDNGPTGTGKTEFAKALSYALYDDDTAIEIQDLSSVYDPDQFVRDLEGPIGRLSAQGGGVLLLDEAQNLGGGDPSRLRQMLLKFYPLIDEKSYTGPSGISYDLRNIFIRFTGNFGQENFSGVRSTYLRQAIWSDLQGTFSDILIKAGARAVRCALGRRLDAEAAFEY